MIDNSLIFYNSLNKETSKRYIRDSSYICEHLSITNHDNAMPSRDDFELAKRRRAHGVVVSGCICPRGISRQLANAASNIGNEVLDWFSDNEDDARKRGKTKHWKAGERGVGVITSFSRTYIVSVHVHACTRHETRSRNKRA